MHDKNAVLNLWNKITGLIDEKIVHAYFDKTFPSVIYGKNEDGTYKIVREGEFYNVPSALSQNLIVTQNVWV